MDKQLVVQLIWWKQLRRDGAGPTAEDFRKGGIEDGNTVYARYLNTVVGIDDEYGRPLLEHEIAPFVEKIKTYLKFCEKWVQGGV